VIALKSDDLPALHRALSARSALAQKRVLLAVEASLGGAVAAAGLSLVEIEVGDADLAALGAALGFLISLLASSWLLWRRPDRDWYDARAGAESVKTLAWQFAVGGGEFAKSDREEEVERRFIARLGELLSDLETLGTAVAATDSQLTPAMKALREESLPTRQAAYRTGRIEDQQRWYAERAKWNERRRTGWAIATLTVQALGLAAGLARAFFGLDIDLLGLAATLVAAITAWARTKDYAELAEAYAVTAHEISLLAAQPMPADRARWAQFVEQAERAFSREHTLWRVRKGQLQIG
jgi:SMODS and SLOG-associating 2TM effector domain 3/SMODS and SLOG-associating 2TM effector domain 1